MTINYFFRQFHQHQISIEKLFEVIISEVSKTEKTKKIINPYGFSISGIFKAIKYFKSQSGDVNHITGDIHWAALALPAKNTILTVHDLVGLNTMSGIKKKIYFEFWVKRPLKKLKYITVISEKTKQEIISYLPEVAQKITVIPNCLTSEVSSEEFKPINTKPEVLIVGTRSNKNIPRMFEALKDLDIHLTIIGELTFEQINFLEQNNFSFETHQNIKEEKLLKCYQKADILAFASLYEGFGLPILEAQAQNCVVITSNIAPMKEVSGGAALLVDPENILEIKNSVQKIINDEQLRKQFQYKGKENIKKYLPERVASQYLEIYKQIWNTK